MNQQTAVVDDLHKARVVYVSDPHQGTARLANWMATVGGVICAALLTWMGLQLVELGRSSSVLNERSLNIQNTVNANARGIADNGTRIDALSDRVSALEYANTNRQQQRPGT